MPRRPRREKRQRTRLLEDEIGHDGPRIGHPTKLDEEMLEKLKTAARLCSSHREIAWACGIDPSTLTRWKQKHPELRTLLEGESAQIKAQLVKLEIDAALGGNVEARRFLLTKRHPDFQTKRPEREDEDEDLLDQDMEDLDFTYL